MDDKTGDAVRWLLSSAEPAARLLAQRDLLGVDIPTFGPYDPASRRVVVAFDEFAMAI